VLAKDLTAGTGAITFSGAVVMGAAAAVTTFSFGAGVVVAAGSAASAGTDSGACFGATLSGRDADIMAGSSAGVETGGGGPPPVRRAGGVYLLGCPEARGWKLR
jgi:hypothetical protein